MKALVAGIGNVLLEDDGIGPVVVQTLAQCLHPDPSIEIEDLGTPGPGLIDYLVGNDVVILVDAVCNDRPPGSIHVYTRSDVLSAGVPMRTGPHALSLSEALATLDLLGHDPVHFLLIGVAAQSCELGLQMSDPVRNAVEPAGAEILRQLEGFGINCARKTRVPSAHFQLR